MGTVCFGLRSSLYFAGDVLYIPALWFHNVVAHDFSVAVNVFWKQVFAKSPSFCVKASVLKTQHGSEYIWTYIYCSYLENFMRRVIHMATETQFLHPGYFLDASFLFLATLSHDDGECLF
jgi:hypothetical protein